jgi:hypothetical protein
MYGGGAISLAGVALARVLAFAVPQWIPIKTSVRLGGMQDRPMDDARVNLLWPLSVDSNGRLVLEAWDRGYMGPAYQALPEFDYFRDHYARRR